MRSKSDVINYFSSRLLETVKKEPIIMKKIKKTGFGLDVTTKELKIIIPNQMNQRLLPAIKQVQADNTSEDLLNEIQQIVFS